MNSLLKFYLTITCCIIAQFSFGQYKLELGANPNTPMYIYVGTLPPSDGNNLHKLKVDILGGAWESFSTGETTYYIANREGLRITQTTSGGTNDGRYNLKGYIQNDNSVAFYLLTNGYAAIAVKSCMLGQNSNILINNTYSSLAPTVGTEIANLTIIPIMYTDAQGNVGFNTTSPDPQYRVSVNGKLRAKEIKVESGWADYVFDKGYQIPKLDEVEKYISINKHLPGVPSAFEVKQNGIEVGEANAILLKKIEELTLYLIDQDKKIKLLSSELRNQKVLLKRRLLNRRK